MDASLMNDITVDSSQDQGTGHSSTWVNLKLTRLVESPSSLFREILYAATDLLFESLTFAIPGPGRHSRKPHLFLSIELCTCQSGFQTLMWAGHEPGGTLPHTSPGGSHLRNKAISVPGDLHLTQSPLPSVLPKPPSAPYGVWGGTGQPD